MTYHLDENGVPQFVPDPDGPPTLVITEAMIKSVHNEGKGIYLMELVAQMLGFHFPDHFNQVDYTYEFVRERGIHYYVSLPSSFCEPYLLERALIAAHADQAHKSGKQFKLYFSTIDPWVLGENHNPLGDDAKPISTGPTKAASTQSP